MRRLALYVLTVIGTGWALAAPTSSLAAGPPPSFATPTTAAVPGPAVALNGVIATADFNHDGHADVASYDGNWQTQEQSLAVWISSPSAAPVSWSWYTLTPPPVAAFAGSAVATADLNPGTDNAPDLLALAMSETPGASQLGVYLGNGDGTFQPQVDATLPGIANGLTVADVNGDGVPDVLVPTMVQIAGAEWQAEVVTLIGQGDGTFGPPIVSPVDLGPESEVIATGVVVGQFTGSGFPDIAVSQAFSPPNDVYVLRGDGSGSFTEPIPLSLGVGSFSLAAGDFDGDGKEDLALPIADSAPSGGTVLDERVATALGNDDGTFVSLAPAEPKWTRGQNPYSYTIHAADLNGDGSPDLLLPVASDAGEGGVWALLSNGDGSFADGVTGLESGNVWDVGAADFDGDGRPDVVALREDLGGGLELAVYDNTSAPSLALDASSLDLGEATVGRTSTRQLTITDEGNYALSVSAVTVGGAAAADFEATGCAGATIAPGESCGVTVSFSPTAPEAEGATLTIASDDPGRPAATVPLSGTGTSASEPSGPSGGAGSGSGAAAAGSGAASPGGAVQGPQPTRAGTLKLARTASVSTKGLVSLKVSCVGGPCQGKVTLTVPTKKKVKGKAKVKPRTLSSARYALGADASGAVALKLPAAALRQLLAARGRKLAVTALVVPTSGARARAKLTLVAPKVRAHRA